MDIIAAPGSADQQSGSPSIGRARTAMLLRHSGNKIDVRSGQKVVRSGQRGQL